jgi:hypothetical protein
LSTAIVPSIVVPPIVPICSPAAASRRTVSALASFTDTRIRTQPPEPHPRRHVRSLLEQQDQGRCETTSGSRRTFRRNWSFSSPSAR